MKIINNEVDLEGFIELCKDYIKTDNKDIFINSIKKLFFIIEKEKSKNNNEKEKNEEKDKEKNKEENKEDNKIINTNNDKIYLLRLKPEYQKEIDMIKEDLNKCEINKKQKEEVVSKQKKSKISKSKNTNNNTAEKISSNKSSKNKKLSFEEKMRNNAVLYSERNKSLFFTLLRHI